MHHADVSAYREKISQQGFAIVPDVLDVPAVERVRKAIARLAVRLSAGGRRGAYAIRNLLHVDAETRTLAIHPLLRPFIAPVLGEKYFAVRAILFDKIPAANWMVPWHQDRVIAVTTRLEVKGFNAWSRKAGVWHVQPPVNVLENMLAVRVHLDDCGPDDGGLRLLPGTHRFGFLNDTAEYSKSNVIEVGCQSPAGGIVVMRPLILHASSPALSPRHRRVIHIEYAAAELPGGLEWNDRVSPSGTYSID